MLPSPTSSPATANAVIRAVATPSGIDVSCNGRRTLLAIDPESGLPPKFVALRADKASYRTNELWLTRQEVQSLLETTAKSYPGISQGFPSIPSLSGKGDVVVDSRIVMALYEAADAKRHAIEATRDRSGKLVSYSRHVGYGEDEAFLTVRFDGGPNTYAPLHSSGQRSLTADEIAENFSPAEIAAQAEKEAAQALAGIRGTEIALNDQDVPRSVQADFGAAFGPLTR